LRRTWRKPRAVFSPTAQPEFTSLIEADPKLGKIDAKNYISDRFLKKLEEEGFVKKLMGR
jgi:hypothetical protein